MEVYKYVSVPLKLIDFRICLQSKINQSIQDF